MASEEYVSWEMADAGNFGGSVPEPIPVKNIRLNSLTQINRILGLHFGIY